MDKATLAAVLALAAAVGVSAASVWTGCAQSATTPGGQPECVVHVGPGAVVLLGLLALAGAGVWAGQPPFAWAMALVALGGSILFMFSLGWFVFPALATCGIVAAWTVARPGGRERFRDRGRLARSAALGVATFGAVSLLYFWQPFTGLFLLVAGIAAVLGLMAFAAALCLPARPAP